MRDDCPICCEVEARGFDVIRYFKVDLSQTGANMKV